MKQDDCTSRTEKTGLGVDVRENAVASENTAEVFDLY